MGKGRRPRALPGSPVRGISRSDLEVEPRLRARQSRRAVDPARLARLRALVDPRRRADVVGAPQARPLRGSPRLPPRVSPRSSSRTGGSRAASTPAAPIPCRSTTATVSSSSSRPSTSASRGTRRRCDALWPRIARTVAAIDALRRQRRTPEYETPEKRVFYGLLPESISHEGYSDKPVHSYWDDAFARKGLADAVELARLARTPGRRPAFRGDSRRVRGGSSRLDRAHDRAESSRLHPGLGRKARLRPDLDHGGPLAVRPPAKAAAGGAGAHVRSLREGGAGTARRDADGSRGDAYTPYELRTVGALVRLGRKAEAHEMLAFFMKDRRPAAWNQWAEVVGRDPRAPRFIGDMPHTWVGTRLHPLVPRLLRDRARGR